MKKYQVRYIGTNGNVIKDDFCGDFNNFEDAECHCDSLNENYTDGYVVLVA